MGRANDKPSVALLVAWLRLLFLGEMICRRRLSGGGRMSAERIIPHLVIKPAGSSLCEAARLRADAAESVNRFSVFVDVKCR